MFADVTERKVDSTQKPIWADRIRESREAKGLTQAELAELSGLHLTTIGKYEAGTRSPKIDDLIEIARAVEQSVAYLVGELNGDTPAYVSTTQSLALSTNRRISPLEYEVVKIRLDLLDEEMGQGRPEVIDQIKKALSEVEKKVREQRDRNGGPGS